MKKSITIFLLLFSFLGFSQTIDSVSVVRGNPYEIFIRVVKPEQVDLDRITAISSLDIYGTQLIRFYFKGCPPSPPVFAPYDTIITYNTGGLTPIRFLILTTRDTMAGCSFPTEPLFIDSTLVSNNQIVSVSELERLKDQISLYPNPTPGILKLEKPESLKIDRMELLDVMGRRVLRLSPQADELDLTRVASGTYSLVITAGQEKMVKKVFKF